MTRGYVPNGQNEKAIRFLRIDYDAALLLKSIDASAEMKYVRLDLTAEWIDPTTGKMLRQAKRDNLILPSTGSGTYGVELWHRVPSPGTSVVRSLVSSGHLIEVPELCGDLIEDPTKHDVARRRYCLVFADPSGATQDIPASSEHYVVWMGMQLRQAHAVPQYTQSSHGGPDVTIRCLLSNPAIFPSDRLPAQQPSDLSVGLGNLWEFEVPPKAYIGPHRHDETEEVYYITQGYGVMTVDGKERCVYPGDTIVVQIGSYHSLFAGPEGVTVLVINSIPKKLQVNK